MDFKQKNKSAYCIKICTLMWKKVQLLIQSDTHFWNFTKWVSNYKSGYHFDKVGIKITAQLCYTSISVPPWKTNVIQPSFLTLTTSIDCSQISLSNSESVP